MENIKLEVDPVIHDMSLAKEFLEKNNNKFDFIPTGRFDDIEKKLMKDDVPNEVRVLPIDKEIWEYIQKFFLTNHLEKTTDGNRGHLLKKLQAKAKMFSQLEYMIRNIQEDETMANLKLIQQCIQMPEDVMSTNKRLSVMFFSGRFPLSVLGLAISFIHNGQPFLLVATQKTAAIATLFVQLCHKAGFLVNLVFVDDDEFKQENFSHYNELYYGHCTGIVTETADIDTSLETFLSSFSKIPFSINRVLVQENVYDSFKKSLEWKCRAIKIQQDISEEIKSTCSIVRQVDNKTFLLDYLGDATLADRDGIILVEAYRTDSELFSLLKVLKPFCVTLWCNDVTTANKIAYSINAAFTWINDYCSFEGPPELSQAFCSRIGDHSFNIKGKLWLDVEQLAQKLENQTGILQELKEQLKIPSYHVFKNLSFEKQGLSIVTGEISDAVYVEYINNSTMKKELLKRVAVAAQLKRVLVIDHMWLSQMDYQLILSFLDDLNVPIIISNNSFANLFPLYKAKCVWTRFPIQI